MLHTLKVRIFPEQNENIINHAADLVVFLAAASFLLVLLLRAAPRLAPSRTVLAVTLAAALLSAGLLVGVIIQSVTGNGMWIGLGLIFGLVVGMLIGQTRDQQRQHDDVAELAGVRALADEDVTLLGEELPERAFVEHETLLREVWQTDWEGNLRLVEAHMSNLRRKLVAAGLNSPEIRTVRGVGYRFNDE